MAFERNWTHRNKHVPWGGGTGAGEILILGKDWSAAAFLWAFAPSEGAAATISLSAALAGVQGILAEYDAGYIHPSLGAVVGATRITPLITEATLEALSWGATPVTDPLVFVHNLLVTPTGEQQRLYAYGTFTLYPGVGD